MRNSVAALAVLSLLAACDGNPLVKPEEEDVIEEPDEGEEVADPTIVPDSVAGNLKAISYDAAAKRLFVTISGIDGTPEAAEYFRNSRAEAGLPAGFEVYTLQEDPLDRFFAGVIKESGDGTVRAATVSDGGQFGYFFGGTWFERDGEFDKPDIGNGPGQGQVSYAGDYVGLDNYSGPVPDLPAGTDPAIQMQYPGRVLGDVFVNVNFSDMLLSGVIFNREALDNPSIGLSNVIISPTTITEDGTFLGDVQIGTDDVGDIAGLFGGMDSAYMAGAVAFIPLPDNPDSFENGVFVLTQCGMNGEDAALCSGTAP